jgi:hypothetical protein
VSVILDALACTQGKKESTIEVRFWREKQQNGYGFDQPRSLVSLVLAFEDGLIRPEASLALTVEVDVPPLNCDTVSCERVQDGKATQSSH